jgi:hypothetical protein
MSPVRRGLVISNCQAQPLKHILSLFCRGIRFDGFGVHLLNPKIRSEEIDRFVATAANSYDVVLSVQLSDDFGPLSTTGIRDAFPGRVIATIPNFYFSGLHPDLTYVGGLGRRITGPLSDYHSKVAILGYVAGFSVDQTVRLFCDDNFQKLGFYEEYSRSMTELARRDATLTISYTEEIAKLLREDLCFFSVNHPTSFLLSHFCQKVCNWLETQGLAGCTGWICRPSSLPNHLAHDVCFPVYPEIAAKFDLPFLGSYEFKPATIGDTPVTCLNLREFVDAEFRCLAEIPPTTLEGSTHVGEFLARGRSALGLSGAAPPPEAQELKFADKAAESPIGLQVGYRISAAERLVADNSGLFVLNAAAFGRRTAGEIDSLVSRTLDDALSQAKLAGRKLDPNSSQQLVNDDVIRSIGDAGLDQAGIRRLRSVLASYAVRIREMKGSFWAPDPSPRFDLQSQQAVMRYGNVELRVLENYMVDPSALREALNSLLSTLDDESVMYAPGAPTNFLEADDARWNLRMLMTNAGFYSAQDPTIAWTALKEWAERYLQALRQSWLASFPPAYPFYFSVQRAIWDAWGEAPKYVCHPGPFDLYQSLAAKSVLFMSPFAHLVNKQVETGRLYRLFKDYACPHFALRAIPAWVSTWPNRPHGDWLETFSEMRKAVDDAFAQQAFDVFLASCGCYGLPICDYARSVHGCRTAYFGNITNTYFGIRQRASREFMRDRVDPEMWLDGDLSRYTNVHRIDDGRYI